MSAAQESSPASSNGTGEHRAINSPAKSPSGESVSIRLPINWRDALPYFFLAVLGGDRIFSEYINAPSKIRDLEAKIVALSDTANSVDQRLRNIERALNVPSTQPSFRP